MKWWFLLRGHQRNENRGLMMLLLTLGVTFIALLAGSYRFFNGIGQTAIDPVATTRSIINRPITRKQSVAVLMLMMLSLVVMVFTGSKLGLYLPMLLVLLSLPLLVARWTLRVRANRRRLTLQAELSDSLTQMSSSMQAGATLATAMRWYIEESSGPFAQELFIVQHEHRLGAHLDDALRRLGTRVALRELDLVICAILVARETGGNLAGVLSQLSASVRQQLEIKAKISSLTAQGVMQGWIVSLLPALVGAALYVLDPVAIKPLFSGLLGWLCLITIVILEISGALMIGRIVRIDV